MFQRTKKHKFLLEELIKRDFKKKYKRSVLGMGWSVLSPLLMLLVMRLVFGELFGNRNVPHFTTYLFCGNLVFAYFNESATQGMTTLMSNASIFTKVNVPKFLFLLSKNLQTLINFGITLVVFFVFCAIDGISFGFHLFALIIPIFCLVLFNIGVGMILSSMFVFFRDIQYLWTVFAQLLMYMSAIFYRVEAFSEWVQKVFYVNPIYGFISYFRKVVIGGVFPEWWHNLIILAYALIVLGIGAIIYKKNNHKFLYYV